ncbi:MAG: N-acetylmuramoyl-L-alanine amidase [Chloroflexota bacterium]|nr:N-acetylmuramoyl-L-alanine amidase [Chloroflexota bacterium]
MIRQQLAALLVAAALLPAFAPVAVAENNTISSFRVIASPFTSDDVSTRHAAGIRLTMARGAIVTLTIDQPGGAVVRRLASGDQLAAGNYSWAWAGADDGGALMPDGDYVAHLVVQNGLGSDSRTRSLRKGMPPIYPANPGAITILINPGHGGINTGAATKKVTEKFLNLDIGLRLQRLLVAAGVNVVMTRTTDVHIPDPEFDVNGDGVIGPTKPGGDDWDGLAYRIDMGNEARADLHIFNHNNGAGCRCRRGTMTFTGLQRSWTPEGTAFATYVQAQQINQLDTFRSDTYYPIDWGVRNGRAFYTLSPYSLTVPTPPLEPRPALQPTVLTESLYVSDPIERGLLMQPIAREAIAIGMYLGIRDYLATRDYGIRYSVVDAPATVPVNGAADYQLQVTNTGNQTSSGWKLQLHSVPAVPFYDGSEAIGDLMGSVAIPDGLAPGQTTTLTVHAVAPPASGGWLVKGDVFIGGAERPYLSQRGVVALQVPLTTEP